jgi:hypothetical protein
MGDTVAVADAAVKEPVPLNGSSVDVEFVKGYDMELTGLTGGVEMRVVVPGTVVLDIVGEKGGMLKVDVKVGYDEDPVPVPGTELAVSPADAVELVELDKGNGAELGKEDGGIVVPENPVPVDRGPTVG